MARNRRPVVPVPGVVVFNRHSVPSKVAEAFYPRILKSWNRFVEQRHHGVGQIYEHQHVFQACRQAVSQELEKRMNAVPPHASGHRVL